MTEIRTANRQRTLPSTPLDDKNILTYILRFVVEQFAHDSAHTGPWTSSPRPSLNVNLVSKLWNAAHYDALSMARDGEDAMLMWSVLYCRPCYVRCVPILCGHCTAKHAKRLAEIKWMSVVEFGKTVQ